MIPEVRPQTVQVVLVLQQYVAGFWQAGALWRSRNHAVLAPKGIPRVLCPEGQFYCVPDESIPPDSVALADDARFCSLLILRRSMMWMTATAMLTALGYRQL
jgi:hypothetical protein